MIGVCGFCQKLYETTEEDACTPGSVCPKCYRTAQAVEREVLRLDVAPEIILDVSCNDG